jgi:cellulose synthase/poly-beta-1,6-N-acetylglucosamine synthase-like glycosyltransferase
MRESSRTPAGSGFTVGICATGSPSNLGSLVQETISESDMARLNLRKVVVVASGCRAPVVAEVRQISERDPRVQVVAEEQRHGKADAINKIQALAEGDILVLLNSDARPERGAISRLLLEAQSDPSAGAVSAMPVTKENGDLTSILTDLMWTTHNECSVALNHMGLSNHSCDELVAFRTSAIASLPEGLVNDGAFLAATVRRKGYSVRVCQPARVEIETPTRVQDVIRQRRRILFGHAQVWRKIGSPPRTIESLLFISPATSVRLLVSTLAKSPRFLVVAPIALLTELAATLLSINDAVRSSGMHAVWRRFS